MAHFLNFRNTHIHYDSKGAGSPIVLLHGFLESMEIWNETTGKLSTQSQVITIDLPGHGKSGNFSGVHTMEDMAAAVIAVLQKLNVSQSRFIGHSMGGYVALALLEKDPARFTDLMLLNSTPEADSSLKQLQRERAISLVKKNKKVYISIAISNLVGTDAPARLHTKVNNLKEKAYKFSSLGIVAALYGMKLRPDRSRILTAFKGSKMIVSGDRDPLIDSTHIKEVATKCDSEFHLLHGGHLSYLESKEAFWELCISSKK